jgi:cytoskeletal protein RodZ
MRAIKNFFHNINDVLLAIIIVAIASGIIYWRMQIILDYPKQLAETQAQQTYEQQEQAGEAASEKEETAEADKSAEEEKAAKADKSAEEEKAAKADKSAETAKSDEAEETAGMRNADADETSAE